MVAKFYHHLAPREFYLIMDIMYKNKQLSEGFRNVYMELITDHVRTWTKRQLTHMFDILVELNLGNTSGIN